LVGDEDEAGSNVISTRIPPSESNQNHECSFSTKKSSKSHGVPFGVLSSIPTIHVKNGKDFKEKGVSDSAVLICSRQGFLDLISEDSHYFDKAFLENLNLVVVSNVHEALTCLKVRIDLKKILRKIEYVLISLRFSLIIQKTD